MPRLQMRPWQTLFPRSASAPLPSMIGPGINLSSAHERVFRNMLGVGPQYIETCGSILGGNSPKKLFFFSRISLVRKVDELKKQVAARRLQLAYQSDATDSQSVQVAE